MESTASLHSYVNKHQAELHWGATVEINPKCGNRGECVTVTKKRMTHDQLTALGNMVEDWIEEYARTESKGVAFMKTAIITQVKAAMKNKPVKLANGLEPWSPPEADGEAEAEEKPAAVENPSSVRKLPLSLPSQPHPGGLLAPSLRCTLHPPLPLSQREWRGGFFFYSLGTALREGVL